MYGIEVEKVCRDYLEVKEEAVNLRAWLASASEQVRRFKNELHREVSEGVRDLADVHVEDFSN
jgi:hypothetical protein